MHLDQTPCDGQSEPEPALAAIEGCLCLGERLEQTRQHLRRDPTPGILDPDDRLPLSLVGVHGDRRLATGRRELDRVLKQIADHLREARPVTVRPDLCRGASISSAI